MRVWVPGEKPVTLSKKHFVGQGGQASVYAREGRAFKIYHKLEDMMPEGKLLELSRIREARVIRPQSLALDKSQQPIGYTMRHVAESYALCQLFPRAFRERHQIDSAAIHKLVQQLRAGIDSVHRAQALLVDANEMNFLVSRDFQELFFVDVDSYQTPSYPATAIMESIRDRHATGFSKETDWFSFAVVAFQMFVGIHPYKGKHPSCKGLDARMQANISVFDSRVRVPRVAYDVAEIPSSYRGWLEAVLQQGVREAPPTSLCTRRVQRIAHSPQLNSAKISYESMAEFQHTVVGHYSCGHRQVVATSEGIWLNGRRASDMPEAFVGIAFSSGGYPVSVSQREEGLQLFDLERRRELGFGVRVTQAVVSDERIHAISGAQLLEVQLEEFGETLLASSRVVAQVLEHGTQLFAGVALQDLLGSSYISVLAQAGRSYQLALPELSGAKVLDARLEGRVLMVSVHEDGKLHRLVFRFTDTFDAYDCRQAKDVDVSTLNFAVLDTGVCVCLAEDEAVELFHCHKGAAQLDRIVDTSLRSDMKIVSRGAKILVLCGNRILHMSMK